MDANTVIISRGAHPHRGNRVSLLEAVAWAAGEPHSDQPQCVCPVITSFGRSWNDSISSDEERALLLRPLIPRLIGSRSTAEVEMQRAFLALDWLVRVQVPGWLHLTDSLQRHAGVLHRFPQIKDSRRLQAAIPLIAAARSAARYAAAASSWVEAWTAATQTKQTASCEAAKASAWIISGNVAGEAVKAAAGMSARSAAAAAATTAKEAAWEAWDVAREAAWAAAGIPALEAASSKSAISETAAKNAAEAAAHKRLHLTVTKLQISAVDLVHQMIDCR
jgi:hypothetical protein